MKWIDGNCSNWETGSYLEIGLLLMLNRLKLKFWVDRDSELRFVKNSIENSLMVPGLHRLMRLPEMGRYQEP